MYLYMTHSSSLSLPAPKVTVKREELYIWCTIDFKLTEVELVFRSKAMLILYMLVQIAVYYGTLKYITLVRGEVGTRPAVPSQMERKVL